MSRKLTFIPPIPDYDYIREQMKADLEFRLLNRTRKTSLGRPLYERINVQVIMTHECPYNCPFCIERKNPMKGQYDADAQEKSLKSVLIEHPNARLTITGGEPSLYIEQVFRLSNVYASMSNNVFVAVNTAGYQKIPDGIAHINLSVNDYVHPDVEKFKGCTYQTVLTEDQMNLKNIKRIMSSNPAAGSFSFRFLCDLNKDSYDVSIWNALQNDPEITVKTFRIGDFFVYCTFDWNGIHVRVTLGDMCQQQKNDYQDGYSNIIIHPDGRIGLNWT